MPKAKVGAFKAKKAVLKGNNSHKKKICRSLTFWNPRHCDSQFPPKYPQKSTPRRKKIDRYVIVKLPLSTESAMKKIEDNSFVYMVDVNQIL
ncbi:60S ribosomal protein L23a [Galemys pyrenaicus]|uniref:60S ribosomal protein L23a n=1 Tax=Galemys pyrenaicus TaxID=202257 RepID=A0A8J6AVT1_GALPY|nr:60S ribosomal protein L23a [Galemys pyrenaicus]